MSAAARRIASFFNCFGILFATLLLGAGCATDPNTGGRPARARNAQMPLEGSALLFENKVEVNAVVAAFDLDEVVRPMRPGDRGHRPRGGPTQEFGTPDTPPTRAPGVIGPHALAQATHRIRVSFTNKTSDPIQFDVYEVRSVLGVFGVRPNRLNLGPGETVNIDPMRSSIGENFQQIDMAIAVRHRSKAETVNLTLKPVAASGE